VLYREKPIDHRGCGECQCGAPVGSGCLASLRFYDDAACGSQFATNPISSSDPQCVKIIPPGRAIGAKAITDLAYVPGSCSASGGEPTGAASPDPINAVTFCCLYPFYDLK
jgi:hypothetical protein